MEGHNGRDELKQLLGSPSERLTWQEWLEFCEVVALDPWRAMELHGYTPYDFLEVPEEVLEEWERRAGEGEGPRGEAGGEVLEASEALEAPEVLEAPAGEAEEEPPWHPEFLSWCGDGGPGRAGVLVAVRTADGVLPLAFPRGLSLEEALEERPVFVEVPKEVVDAVLEGYRAGASEGQGVGTEEEAREREDQGLLGFLVRLERAYKTAKRLKRLAAKLAPEEVEALEEEVALLEARLLELYERLRRSRTSLRSSSNSSLESTTSG